LTTIHSAKGLEWEHVVIAGFVQGLLPHGRIDDYGNIDVEFSNMEEERRLAYVAVTRARSTLVLSRVERTLSANKVSVPAFKSTFWLDAEEVFEAAKGPKPKSATICLSQISRRQPTRKTPPQEEIKPTSGFCLRDVLQRRRR
jgi:ATP-dependent DNA helicase Rep